MPVRDVNTLQELMHLATAGAGCAASGELRHHQVVFVPPVSGG
jgi:hypothetical protein